MHQILIGADPELFVASKKTNRPISAHNLFPGTKEHPHKVALGAIQVDGVAAEFNIHPAASLEEFKENIMFVKGALWRALKQNKNGEDFKLVAQPTAKFTRRYWETIPDEAKVLGCEPDYDAYTLDPNEKPQIDKFMRTGAGHIHISWGEKVEDFDLPWFEKCATLVKHLDKHLYPESLKWDTDLERQKLYGKPGAFRPKTYGVEYRVLSNKWVDSPRIQEYVYKSTHMITSMWLKGVNENMYNVMPYVGA